MELRATREVARPADQVFAFFSDASNNVLWQSGMRSCEWTSSPPIREGSSYLQLARFMGRDIRSSFVITEFEPGRRIVIKSTESTFPIEVERNVESTGPGTSRVSAVIRGGPAGPARVLAPLMTRIAQRSVDRDYDRLVELLDSGSHLRD